MQIALGSCLEHVDKPKISTQCQEEMHWFFENTWWWIRRICLSTTKPMDRCYKAQNLVPMYQSTLRNPKFILSSGEISCRSTYFFVDGRNPAPPDLYETPANCGIFTNLNWCNIFFPSTHITLVGRWADSIRLFFSDHFFLKSLMTPSTCDTWKNPNVGGLEVRKLRFSPKNVVWKRPSK